MMPVIPTSDRMKTRVSSQKIVRFRIPKAFPLPGSPLNPCHLLRWSPGFSRLKPGLQRSISLDSRFRFAAHALEQVAERVDEEGHRLFLEVRLVAELSGHLNLEELPANGRPEF